MSCLTDLHTMPVSRVEHRWVEGDPATDAEPTVSYQEFCKDKWSRFEAWRMARGAFAPRRRRTDPLRWWAALWLWAGEPLKVLGALALLLTCWVGAWTIVTWLQAVTR